MAAKRNHGARGARHIATERGDMGLLGPMASALIHLPRGHVTVDPKQAEIDALIARGLAHYALHPTHSYVPFEHRREPRSIHEEVPSRSLPKRTTVAKVKDVEPNTKHRPCRFTRTGNVVGTGKWTTVPRYR